MFFFLINILNVQRKFIKTKQKKINIGLKRSINILFKNYIFTDFTLQINILTIHSE